MAVVVESKKVLKMLHESYKRNAKTPTNTCPAKEMIDFIMEGRHCLTYRYIMFTALAAKAVNAGVDILSMQANDSSPGAYDARTLCKETIFPFQKMMLGNIIDGSNNDPLVNKPARTPRLLKTNPVAGGDPKKALGLLCDCLPTIRTSADALQCVDYMVSMLLCKKKTLDRQKKTIEDAAKGSSAFEAYMFLSDLLNQGFGGAALVLVTAALYQIKYSGKEFRISVHPVNQSGGV